MGVYLCFVGDLPVCILAPRCTCVLCKGVTSASEGAYERNGGHEYLCKSVTTCIYERGGMGMNGYTCKRLGPFCGYLFHIHVYIPLWFCVKTSAVCLLAVWNGECTSVCVKSWRPVCLSVYRQV